MSYRWEDAGIDIESTAISPDLVKARQDAFSNLKRILTAR